MKALLLISAAFIALPTLLSGCAGATRYNQVRAIPAGQAVFVDAKQRAIYGVSRTVGKEKSIGVCAEPSPDALSALAETLGVDFTLTDKGKVGVTRSVAESAGSLGVRTAAIATLRDIMYRNCEAYALGGISDIGLETLQRRFQSTMVAILAIEQLTGAVRGPPVVLTGSSSTGSADAILELTNKTETARGALNDAESAASKAKGNYDAAVATRKATEKNVTDGNSEAKGALENDKKAEEAAKEENRRAQAITKDREEAFASLDSARSAAIAAGGKIAMSGQVEPIVTQSVLSDGAAKAVAAAVFKIVQVTTSRRFSPELCTTILGQYANTTPKPNSALDVCKKQLEKGEMMQAR